MTIYLSISKEMTKGIFARTDLAFAIKDKIQWLFEYATYGTDLLTLQVIG